MLHFFLLVITGKIFAQKKGFKIKPPDHIKVQYAGGIGFISIGAGYSTKNQKLEGDLSYGYLPKSVGGIRIHSNLWKGHMDTDSFCKRIKKYQVEPLMTGLCCQL
jgi:hypothetical protein